MHARSVFVLSLLVIFDGFAVPAFSQQSSMVQQMPHPYASHDLNLRPEPLPGFDPQAMRHKAITQDVAELSVLSASLQEELLQFQKGMLAKDFGEKLKKVEKLSKRLRQEMEQEAAALTSSVR